MDKLSNHNPIYNHVGVGIAVVALLLSGCSAGDTDRPTPAPETAATAAEPMYDYGVLVGEGNKLADRTDVTCYTYGYAADTTNVEVSHCGQVDIIQRSKAISDTKVTAGAAFMSCYMSEGAMLRMRAPSEAFMDKDETGYWDKQQTLYIDTFVHDFNATLDGRPCMEVVDDTARFFDTAQNNNQRLFNIDPRNPF